MYCVNCGNTVKDGVLMCTICGEPMQNRSFEPLSYKDDDLYSTKTTMINGKPVDSTVGNFKKKEKRNNRINSIIGNTMDNAADNANYDYGRKSINSGVYKNKIMSLLFLQRTMDPKMYFKLKLIQTVIYFILIIIFIYVLTRYIGNLGVENQEMHELMQLLSE